MRSPTTPARSAVTPQFLNPHFASMCNINTKKVFKKIDKCVKAFEDFFLSMNLELKEN